MKKIITAIVSVSIVTFCLVSNGVASESHHMMKKTHAQKNGAEGP